MLKLIWLRSSGSSRRVATESAIDDKDIEFLAAQDTLNSVLHEKFDKERETYLSRMDNLEKEVKNLRELVS